jgi:5-methyltetrahydropteroyltriglutamate--homocysteine methyltransferase
VVTDGEMRRQSFQSQMTAAVEGFGEFSMDAFLWGEWHDAKGVHRKPRPEKIGATGKLYRQRPLSAHEFVYLKGKTTRLPKVTLPSPGLWANFWSREYSSSFYPTLDSFFADVVQILRAEIQELVGLGASYIQIDAPQYGLLLDSKTRAFYEQQGWNLSEWVAQGVELDNAIIDGFTGVTFALHL